VLLLTISGTAHLTTEVEIALQNLEKKTPKTGLTLSVFWTRYLAGEKFHFRVNDEISRQRKIPLACPRRDISLGIFNALKHYEYTVEHQIKRSRHTLLSIGNKMLFFPAKKTNI
jgi:hypothetical protein